MNVTRRKFLRMGGVCALVAAGSGLSPSQLVFGQSRGKNLGRKGYDIPYESKTDRVFYFNRETFAPYVGTDFRLFQKGARRKGADLRLEEVFDNQAQLKSRRLKAHDGECFSLFFRGPAAKDFPQSTYRFEHASLGTFSLFLVPGRDEESGSVVYEAVINHLT